MGAEILEWKVSLVWCINGLLIIEKLLKGLQM